MIAFVLLVRGSFSVPEMSKWAYFRAKTGVPDAHKSVEDFLESDFGFPRCSQPILEGPILGFPDPKTVLLRSLSDDFDVFL